MNGCGFNRPAPPRWQRSDPLFRLFAESEGRGVVFQESGVIVDAFLVDVIAQFSPGKAARGANAQRNLAALPAFERINPESPVCRGGWIPRDVVSLKHAKRPDTV